MKKLSIIVAAYNVGTYIKECVDSVLNLKMDFTYEVIVINDGSTDNTLEELEKFEKELIKVITIENSGISNVRNLGISVAEGEYLFFIDGDDLINKQDFVFLSRNLNSDYDIIMGGYNSFNELEGLKEVTKFFNGHDSGTGIEIIEKYFYSEFETSVWRAFYKKNNILDNSIYFEPNISIAEDADWLLRLMIVSKKVYFDNSMKIYNYRLREGSVMMSFFSNKKFKDMLFVASNIQNFMLNHSKYIQQMFKLNYYILILIISSSLKKKDRIYGEDLVLIQEILSLMIFKKVRYKLIVFIMRKNINFMLNLVKLFYKLFKN